MLLVLVKNAQILQDETGKFCTMATQAPELFSVVTLAALGAKGVRWNKGARVREQEGPEGPERSSLLA